MSDSKLHLISFAPVPDTKTTVHVVGLPDSLRDALFTLMPPRKEGGYLNTKVLKDDLRCWLDRAVELNPVRPNVHTDSWLIALAPIDLAKLCNVIAVWISSRKDIDTQSPAYRKVMGMLHPETFEEAVRGEEICLFSGDGRPTGRLTFPAFSAQVADAIADIPLELANGMVENFSSVSRGNGNVYELISDIHWHKEDPWAFALRFHVETLPVGRKARLNMDVAVRRFIGKPWQDDPFLKHDVNAYVRTEGGTLRVVPYGYDKQKRDLAWDPAALANYEFASGTGLPAVREYLEDMGRYARDGSQPQILSPYAMTASWASKPSVASGASVIDKAMFFEAVAARLKDIAEPVGALDSLQLTHLKASIEEPRQADWDKDPVSARARQETWGRANRARLAHCTGRDRAVFQLIGNQDDAACRPRNRPGGRHRPRPRSRPGRSRGTASPIPSRKARRSPRRGFVSPPWGTLPFDVKSRPTVCATCGRPAPVLLLGTLRLAGPEGHRLDGRQVHMPASLEEYKPDRTQEQGDISHSGHEEVYEGEGRGNIDPDATGGQVRCEPMQGIHGTDEAYRFETCRQQGIHPRQLPRIEQAHQDGIRHQRRPNQEHADLKCLGVLDQCQGHHAA